MPAFDGGTPIVDVGDPDANDPDRVRAALARHAHAALIVGEGTFALTLTQIRELTDRTAYFGTLADLRTACKVLREITEGKDPANTLRGYLERGRDAHMRHVEPARTHADLVLGGRFQISDLV
ncbi:hypothetical protein [Embleya scabrispora]|uniref:hypothetical protein n=1 Tax=Embleya scabrispora TaxID=159449 RepID=UPI0003801E8E|nr:hypothetical protein [Embleya scabrispora]MYS87780.1 hypothetical protein [Streptomyces sp. SID5474]